MAPPNRNGTVNEIPLEIQTLLSVCMFQLLSHLGGIPARSAGFLLDGTKNLPQKHNIPLGRDKHTF